MLKVFDEFIIFLSYLSKKFIFLSYYNSRRIVNVCAITEGRLNLVLLGSGLDRNLLAEAEFSKAIVIRGLRLARSKYTQGTID